MYTKPMTLNETFAKSRGMPEAKVPDMFGIEIELEGKNIHPINDLGFTQFWQDVEDNSLRKLKPGDQAIEYRFREPMSLDGTNEALTQLEHHLTRPTVKVYESGRTSVHVHVNCLNDSWMTIYNFITLSIIFDELLVSQNGDHRIGNNFCLRARDAEGLIVSMAESVQQFGNLDHINAGNRYSSINIASLYKFGTIEFRSMECSTDRHRLMHWVKTLLALKVAARNFLNPAEIMGQFSQQGPERFFLSTLGPQAIRYMRVADRHRMLFDGLRLIQEFANSATWEPRIASSKTTGKKAVFDPMFDIETAVAAAPPIFNHITPTAGQIPTNFWTNIAQQQIQQAAAINAGPVPVAVTLDDWGDPIELETDDDDDDDFDDEDEEFI